MYEIMKGLNGQGQIKHWTKHVYFESQAIDQLKNIASLPFVFKHVAAMPDVHLGKGATVGSVIATQNAIIPAAVGVDIGCGMIAVRLSLKASDLPESLKEVRKSIENIIPVGFNQHSEKHLSTHKYSSVVKRLLNTKYSSVQQGLKAILEKHSSIEKMTKDVFRTAYEQIGTLGGGNHFIELCLDENQDVWVMLHSGSRGIGNMIGRYFIEQAKNEMIKKGISLPDRDLAYLSEGSELFDDYCVAVDWAQEYAATNREAMLKLVMQTLAQHFPEFKVTQEAINCHHNYVEREVHFGEEVLLTRKGAVSAQKDQLGIIPGSMGAKSYIVRGKGNEESYCSCSHGAGRMMSRKKAKKIITLDEHIAATQGVECRKDKDVLDESPAAYKDIDLVMKSQEDLVEVVHTLKQVMCVKG